MICTVVDDALMKSIIGMVKHCCPLGDRASATSLDLSLLLSARPPTSAACIHRLARSLDSYQAFVRLELSCANENTAFRSMSLIKTRSVTWGLTVAFRAVHAFTKCQTGITAASTTSCYIDRRKMLSLIDDCWKASSECLREATVRSRPRKKGVQCHTLESKSDNCCASGESSSSLIHQSSLVILDRLTENWPNSFRISLPKPYHSPP